MGALADAGLLGCSGVGGGEAGRAAAWPSPADDRSRGAEEGGAAAAAERWAEEQRERGECGRLGAR